MSEKETERFNRNEIICPYCDFEFSDSWDFLPDDLEGFREKVGCPECGQFFSLQKTVTFFYTTRQLAPCPPNP